MIHILLKTESLRQFIEQMQPIIFQETLLGGKRSLSPFCLLTCLETELAT